MIKAYYHLTKPGIIYGNSISVIAGFFVASRGTFDPFLFVTTLLGISLVIASGCVFNNFLDREIDEKMERTKNRELVKKLIPVKPALIFGSILGLFGFGLLYIFVNLLTTFIAFIGFFFYVVMYSIWKRKSIYGTIVGSISGAVPPVVGYTAVSNNFDLAAFLLFLFLIFWQMPHFYAIAIFRQNEYKMAKVPVLSIVKGIKTTKIQIIIYIIAFMLTSSSLTFFKITGYAYLAATIALGLWWLIIGIKGLKTSDDKLWARKMFRISLVVLTLLCFVMSINALV